MDKKTGSVISIYAIIFVIYNILFWVIPFPKNSASMVVYVFSLLSIVTALGITYIAFAKGNGIKSKIYGFPIFKVGIMYAAIQIIFGIIIFVFGCFTEVPVWISIVLSVILAGLVAIGVIATDNARDIIDEQEAETIRRTKTVTQFRLSIDNIVDMCKDAELKKKLSYLSEDFKYSDPMSAPELEEIEKKIKDAVDELKYFVDNGDETASDKAEQIKIMLADRNRQCKMYK